MIHLCEIYFERFDLWYEWFLKDLAHIILSFYFYQQLVKKLDSKMPCIKKSALKWRIIQKFKTNNKYTNK